MIIVTGATGQLGRAVVEQLARRVPAGQIGVSVRDPAKAGGLAELGVRVRYGDFNDVSSLTSAFEGAQQVLIVSSNARASGGDPLVQHANAIAAARAAGATRVVYTSQIASSAQSAFPPARDHAATEAMLRDSGLAWTALRHGFYAASGLMLMGDALDTGVVAAPADGKVSWTAHADLSEAAAIVLADRGCFDGPTPPLTGAEALDLGELARIASDILGRHVERTTISDSDLGSRMAARGAPAGATDILLGLYTASRHGEFAHVDPTLERLLGRPPISMASFIGEKAAQG